MEASESQVKPMTPAKGMADNEDLKLENIDSGVVWGARQGLLEVPDNVKALIDPVSDE